MRVNEIRQDVIRTLDTSFPGVKIYGEEIKQGFIEPCFFVKLFPVSHEREQGRRYKRVHYFDIHYFPSGGYPNEECHEMAEELYSLLEYITCKDGLIRGAGMSHEVVDNVLHFYVQCSVHVVKEQPTQIKMKELEQKGAIADGGGQG